MLNLLISIISGFFGEINEKSVQANYQERARIIAENSYLIPNRVKHQMDDFDKYLILAKEVQEDEDNTSLISTKVKNLVDDILGFVSKLQQIL